MNKGLKMPIGACHSYGITPIVIYPYFKKTRAYSILMETFNITINQWNLLIRSPMEDASN